MPREGEGITPGDLRVARQFPADNVHLLAGPFYLCQQRGFTRWLDEWNPDALIVEANARYLATESAVRWMHARGKPVIGWGLGPGGTGSPGSLLSRARAGYLRHFGLIPYLPTLSGPATDTPAFGLTPPTLTVSGVTDGALYETTRSVTCTSSEVEGLWLTMDGAPWTSGGVVSDGRGIGRGAAACPTRVVTEHPRDVRAHECPARAGLVPCHRERHHRGARWPDCLDWRQRGHPR